MVTTKDVVTERKIVQTSNCKKITKKEIIVVVEKMVAKAKCALGSIEPGRHA